MRLLFIQMTFFAISAVLLSSSEAQSACVAPLEAPSNEPMSSWQDVLTVKATKSLNPLIAEVQDIQTTGIGDVNLDYYSITFDAGISPGEEWATNFRAQF